MALGVKIIIIIWGKIIFYNFIIYSLPKKRKFGLIHKPLFHNLKYYNHFPQSPDTCFFVTAEQNGGSVNLKNGTDYKFTSYCKYIRQLYCRSRNFRIKNISFCFVKFSPCLIFRRLKIKLNTGENLALLLVSERARALTGPQSAQLPPLLLIYWTRNKGTINYNYYSIYATLFTNTRPV